LTADPRIPWIRNLLWVTLFAGMVFGAPATIPNRPEAIPASLALSGWFVVVTTLGLRTVKQVGLSRSGILTPFLLLLVALESAFLVAMTGDHLLRLGR
jgi:hypothetical protein